jgi:hypothetical protein
MVSSIKEKKGVSFEEEYASASKVNNFFTTYFTICVLNNIKIL